MTPCRAGQRWSSSTGWMPSLWRHQYSSLHHFRTSDLLHKWYCGATRQGLMDSLPPDLDPTALDRDTWMWIGIGSAIIAGIVLLVTLLMIRRIWIAVACIKVGDGSGLHQDGGSFMSTVDSNGVGCIHLCDYLVVGICEVTTFISCQRHWKLLAELALRLHACIPSYVPGRQPGRGSHAECATVPDSPLYIRGTATICKGHIATPYTV